MPKLIDIRKARKQRGWTQEDLADKAGVDQATVSDLETGRSRYPRFDIVKRIAIALECDPMLLKIGEDGHSEASR